MSILASMPVELITGAASFVMGYIGKIHQMKMETQQMMMKMSMQSHNQNMETRSLIQGSDKERERFQWTRRTLAITLVGSIVVLPKVAYLALGIPSVYTWVETTNKFLWFSGMDVSHFTVINGLIYLPYESHLVAAVVGMYFGKGR